jgi:SOS response regulatory protein OraA/RecX
LTRDPGGAQRRDAHEAALRALRHRDLSVRELDERLRERGFSESERDEAIDTLVRTGLVDDVRYAESRARQLAGRGAGDALIRHTLARAGVEATVASDALLTLPPEAERARSVLERRGPGPRTARYLLGKGFSEEVVSGVFAPDGADELG